MNHIILRWGVGITASEQCEYDGLMKHRDSCRPLLWYERVFRGQSIRQELSEHSICMTLGTGDQNAWTAFAQEFN
jgi:hypothetical protein